MDEPTARDYAAMQAEIEAEKSPQRAFVHSLAEAAARNKAFTARLVELFQPTPDDDQPPTAA